MREVKEDNCMERQEKSKKENKRDIERKRSLFKARKTGKIRVKDEKRPSSMAWRRNGVG